MAGIAASAEVPVTERTMKLRLERAMLICFNTF
jgi:hypothetical protein